MSENAVETEVVDTETVESEALASEQPKPTETVDFWKAKAREQEKRAKENAVKAKQFDELQAATLSDSERAAKEKAEALKDAADARAEALRWRTAAKHGLSDEDAELFLTGTDEDTLTRQAERLVARTPVPGKGSHVPGVGQQPATPPNLNEQIAAAEAEHDFGTALRLKSQLIADIARNQ